MFGLFANDCPEETWEEMIENNVDEYIESFLDDMEYWDNQPIEQVLNIGFIWEMRGNIMTEMEYENYCEMLSVMDRPVKIKTVTLNSDIIDGKPRQHVNWNNLNIKAEKRDFLIQEGVLYGMNKNELKHIYNNIIYIHLHQCRYKIS